MNEYANRVPLQVPPDDVKPMSRFLLEQCPVTHSDVDGGFWLINRHSELTRVLRDPERFVSGNRGCRVPHDPPGINRPPMPPIDFNPPLLRKVREVMNPFFTPAAVARYEPAARSIIRELIDGFANEGHCDLANQLAKQFPSRITCQELLEVTDEAELDQLRMWNQRQSYDLYREAPEVMAEVQRQWSAWSYELVAKRTRDPGDDIVSALIRAQLDGRSLLNDAEVVGAIQILIAGGFGTTADATCSITSRLIEDPGLETLLRADPTLIPAAIDETLRLEPPITTRPRRCTADTEIGGVTIPAGDRVLCNYVAANIDPREWENPDEFNIERGRKRGVAFSIGPHHCIGATMARMTLRVVVEELLARVTNLRYADELGARRVSHAPGAWRKVDSMPITFSPTVQDVS